MFVVKLWSIDRLGLCYFNCLSDLLIRNSFFVSVSNILPKPFQTNSHFYCSRYNIHMSYAYKNICG